MTSLHDQLQAALGDTYTIERELGGGGMSRVFLAQETAFGRRVVVKVLPSELAGSVSIARFRREIALAARLQHPHIVALIAAGELGELPYYTMPFVDGESLRERLKHGELPIVEVVSIMRDVARALEYAHSKGVAHRDIKPDNVLLSGSTAVITDFGVAKALSDSSNSTQLTSIGVALGTPAYMAPEQALADPATDIRADIYAFGAMAYEMLSGHPPFSGRSAQATLAAHATEVPPPIGALRSATPPALAQLIMHCLEKRPGDRPQSASAIVHSLDGIGMATPVAKGRRTTAASADTLVATARPWRMAAALLLVASVVGVGAWWRARAGGADTSVIRSIAVLPCNNESRDSTIDYLENGITDHVRDALNGIPELTVKARSSSQPLKGHEPKDIGSRLGVVSVLQCTVDRPNGASNSKLHVTAELVSVAGGTALWSHTYEPEMRDVGDVQDSITRGVVARLHLAHGGTPDSRGTTDPIAYQLFLKAQYAADRFDLPRAVNLLRDAVDRDPRFARAQGLLAIAYASGPIVGISSVDSSLALARATVAKARSLDPTVVESYIAEALLIGSDYTRLDEALKPLETAMSTDSNNVDLLWNYSLALAQNGRVKDALAVATRARIKDPLRVVGLLGSVLALAHEYGPAITETRATLDLDPNHVIGYRQLGILYAFTEKPDSALAAFETAYKLDAKNFGTAANLVFGYAAAGRWSDAMRQRALVKRGVENSPNYDDVVIAIAFGDYDAAMKALQRGVLNADPFMGTISIPCDLMFEPLRAKPAFKALMARMHARDCPATGKWPIGKPPAY